MKNKVKINKGLYCNDCGCTSCPLYISIYENVINSGCLAFYIREKVLLPLNILNIEEDKITENNFYSLSINE